MVALPLVLPPSVLGFYLLLTMGPHGPVGQATKVVLGLGPLPFMVQPMQTAFEAVGDRSRK